MARSPSLWLHNVSARLSNLPTGQGQGATDMPRPPGKLIWLHCPTPEAEPVVLEILRHLIEYDLDQVFLVTKTSPGALILPGEPGALILTAPTPAESTAALRGFAEHWKPDACLFFASGVLPNHIEEAHARKIPVFLIGDGNIENGLQGPALRGLAARALLRRVSHVFAQSAKWADLYRRQGLTEDRLTLTGQLSQGTVVLPCNEAERERFARALAGRPAWLAAGLGPDEEDIALDAHRAAARHSHRVLMFLAPDDPARGPDLAARLAQHEFSTGLRSAGDIPDPDMQIYVADRPDELGLWYRLAPVCLIGHTFGAGDPQDPLAPAALGSAILHGPNTRPHESRFQFLDDARAARAVRRPADLAVALSEMLSPDTAAIYARNAWEASTAGVDATEIVAERLYRAAEDRGAG
ncbi:3-deoxy-D-manno-octulosonic acid transferase [Actibacterium ureilyticum]|uniref:3-deoxy-D-manno-octulosonic acid transferase n=1 Tax=Actibacterium ureilyticum TaxID=1590614 RepID=UPI000BAA9CB4|nr:glycosyltransferase N-terminal domain-containing protein [Actibacterium ureilyticum]